MSQSWRAQGLKNDERKRDGLYLLILGCLVFVLLGSALEAVSPVSMTDLRAYYYSTRVLLQKHDPYNASDVMRIYRAEEKERPNDSEKNQEVITKFIYFPPTLVLTAPMGAMPFDQTRLIWMILNAGCLILGSFAAWDLAAEYAPLIGGALAGFLVANSELVLITGNSVGIAVGLCVVSVWCITKGRLTIAGILCMAISLMLKPHDAGLIWVYLILAGGIYRKRAWQILAATTVLSIPGFVWISIVSPHWLHELRGNMTALSVHGGVADPGPASSGAHALAMQINLQTVVSVFWDNPSFYNAVSYLVCGMLFLIWAAGVLRPNRSPKMNWVALAFAASLSMLPLYHRQGDAKLLLLIIPAAALMWVRGGRLGKVTLAVTWGGLFATAEIPWAILLEGMKHLHVPDSPWARWGLIAIQVFPIPLTLLSMSIYYLWLLPRSERRQVVGAEHAKIDSLIS